MCSLIQGGEKLVTYSDAWLKHLDTERITGNNKVYAELVSTCKNIIASSNFIELGCGPGTFLDTCHGFKLNCKNYFGIDADKKLISIAKQKHGDKFSTCNLCSETELLRKVLRDNVFDTLLCVRLLNYLDDHCLHEVLKCVSSSSVTKHIFVIPLERNSNVSCTEILQYEFNGFTVSQYLRSEKMYVNLIENTLQTRCRVQNLYLNNSKLASHLLVMS